VTYEDGYSKLHRELLGFQQGIRERIVVWLVQTGIATNDQLRPILDGSYEDELPDEMFDRMPEGLPTGLGDGSLWPQGMRLPNYERGYHRLFGIPEKTLDRLVTLHDEQGDFRVVADVEAVYASAVKDHHVPPAEEIAAMTAEVQRRLRDSDLDPERIRWLRKLWRRLKALHPDWSEPALRSKLEEFESIIREEQDDDEKFGYYHVRLLRAQRLGLIFKLTSLGQDDPVFLRGYRVALKRYLNNPELRGQALRDRTFQGIKGVLVQLKTEDERDRYVAGVEQGLADGAWNPGVELEGAR
jgi:hypothetical protein